MPCPWPLAWPVVERARPVVLVVVLVVGAEVVGVARGPLGLWSPGVPMLVAVRSGGGLAHHRCGYKHFTVVRSVLLPPKRSRLLSV